jgi:coenzyme PQQ biosynthesis protein PqqD
MNDSRRPIQAPGFKLEVVDEEVILFHPARTSVIHTNRSGGLIWQLCDGARSVEEIIELLRQMYPDSVSEIANDVERVLGDLTDGGVVQWL